MKGDTFLAVCIVCLTAYWLTKLSIESNREERKLMRQHEITMASIAPSQCGK